MYEEVDYMADMQAEAEQEAQAAEAEQYGEYLDSLLKNKDFTTWKYETVIDELNSKEFKSSGISSRDFFAKKLSTIKNRRECSSDSDDMEF